MSCITTYVRHPKRYIHAETRHPNCTRITGGGFGGCTVTLVEKDQADALIEHIHKNYTLGKATCFTSTPGEGAHAESL